MPALSPQWCWAQMGACEELRDVILTTPVLPPPGRTRLLCSDCTISERTAYEPHSKRGNHAHGAGWRGYRCCTSASFSPRSCWRKAGRPGRTEGRRRPTRRGTKRATRRRRVRWKPSPSLPCRCSGRTSSVSPAEPRGTWSEEEEEEEGVPLLEQVALVLVLVEEDLEEELEEEEEEEQEEGGNPDSCYSLGPTYLGESP